MHFRLQICDFKFNHTQNPDIKIYSNIVVVCPLTRLSEIYQTMPDESGDSNRKRARTVGNPPLFETYSPGMGKRIPHRIILIQIITTA